MLDRLIFDTTDADTRAASANVGAYLRASDGTLLTHTDVGGKKALDVRVAEGINVEVDLNFADDSVTAHQGGTWEVSLDSATLAALETITVVATNLDIRDLAFATDKVDVTGSEVSLDSATLAALENITVSATNLDIRDLVAATDSVSAWTKDGAGTAITSRAEDGGQALDVHVTGSGPLTINDAALANTAVLSAVNVLDTANTAEAIKASALANRKYLWVYNNDNTRVFIGGSGVSAANGFPVSPGSYLELRAGPAISPFFVGQSGKTPEVRTLELS
jgi:hypothetical protein